ncbi:hypothetical protein NPIL_276131 [Nephila pilipes]|uniref:Uncharacterized protein n=1 Tax=Nephila pilipes TaxID=299642 RepID=A0A8X6Q4R4_NEPPI|nr:hypothetical protein NPIL_276131 [Nephila pilipes]
MHDLTGSICPSCVSMLRDRSASEFKRFDRELREIKVRERSWGTWLISVQAKYRERTWKEKGTFKQGHRDEMLNHHFTDPLRE